MLCFLFLTVMNFQKLTFGNTVPIVNLQHPPGKAKAGGLHRDSTRHTCTLTESGTKYQGTLVAFAVLDFIVRSHDGKCTYM